MEIAKLMGKRYYGEFHAEKKSDSYVNTNNFYYEGEAVIRIARRNEKFLFRLNITIGATLESTILNPFKVEYNNDKIRYKNVVDSKLGTIYNGARKKSSIPGTIITKLLLNDYLK